MKRKPFDVIVKQNLGGQNQPKHIYYIVIKAKNKIRTDEIEISDDNKIAAKLGLRGSNELYQRLLKSGKYNSVLQKENGSIYFGDEKDCHKFAEEVRQKLQIGKHRIEKGDIAKVINDSKCLTKKMEFYSLNQGEEVEVIDIGLKVPYVEGAYVDAYIKTECGRKFFISSKNLKKICDASKYEEKIKKAKKWVENFKNNIIILRYEDSPASSEYDYLLCKDENEYYKQSLTGNKREKIETEDLDNQLADWLVAFEFTPFHKVIVINDKSQLKEYL